MSAQEISQQATVLAESLSGCTVARIILANSIVRVVARSRYQSQALTQGEFISLATQASGNIVDAQGDLGKIGKPFGDYLEEEGAFLGDKIMNGTGLPLDDETLGDSRRLIIREEFGVPPRILNKANVRAIRRMRS